MRAEAGTRRPVLLVINPNSGGKPGGRPVLTDDPDQLEPTRLATALRARGLKVYLHQLTEKDDVARLAVEAANSGQDVVVGGGDGTVSQVATALVGSEATLGILAMGSFNNVAHGFGVPSKLDAALDAIAAGRATLLDAGMATRDGDTDGRLFFEAAGVGLDAIGFMVVEMVERHGVRGWWRALKAGWRAIRRPETTLQLTIEGRRSQVRSACVSVCNGPYHGLGFAISPDAEPSDGLLDVAVFRRMSRPEVLWYFLAVVGGRRKREPRVQRERVRAIRVEAFNATLPAHADGQSVGTTPITFSIKPGAIRVFR